MARRTLIAASTAGIGRYGRGADPIHGSAAHVRHRRVLPGQRDRARRQRHIRRDDASVCGRVHHHPGRYRSAAVARAALRRRTGDLAARAGRRARPVDAHAGSPRDRPAVRVPAAHRDRHHRSARRAGRRSAGGARGLVGDRRPIRRSSVSGIRPGDRGHRRVRRRARLDHHQSASDGGRMVDGGLQGGAAQSGGGARAAPGADPDRGRSAQGQRRAGAFVRPPARAPAGRRGGAPGQNGVRRQRQP